MQQERPTVLIATQDQRIQASWRNCLTEHALLASESLKSITELENYLKVKACDVAFVDADLMEPEGVKQLSSLSSRFGNVRFVVFSTEYSPNDEVTAILSGAKGCIRKDISEQLLQRVVHCVKDDEIWVDRHFMTRLLEDLADLIKINLDEFDSHQFDLQLKSLTPRELEIAQLVSTGVSNRRIAQILSITERTVKAHLSCIFRKLSVADRLQLALFMNRSFRVLREINVPSSGNDMNHGMRTN